MGKEKESDKAQAQRKLDEDLAKDKKASGAKDQSSQDSQQQQDEQFKMTEREDSETQEQTNKRDEKVNTVKDAIVNMAKRYDSNTDLKLHAVRRLSKEGLELEFGSSKDRSGEFFIAHQPEILDVIENAVGSEFTVSVEAKTKGMFIVKLEKSE